MLNKSTILSRPASLLEKTPGRLSILLALVFVCSFFLPGALLADPLTPEDIAAFKIEDLQDSNFDTRMRAYRVIQDQNWIEKYKSDVRAAIKAQLRSSDIMMKRTGIQGQNLMRLEDPVIHELILHNVRENQYKMQPQNQYFQRALTEYLLWKLQAAEDAADCILF